MNRNSSSRFSSLPEVDIQRSSFMRNSSHKTTFSAGQLIPIFLDEVLPGDTFELDMNSLVRMSTPIFPVMDSAFLDTYFFFVPSRLLWSHWKDFMGENTTGYWTQNIDYTVPQIITVDDGMSLGFDKGSIGDYFGLPTDVPGLSVSALPFRAYVLCWNEFFRDQNTMPPAYFVTNDNNYDNVSRAYCLDNSSVEDIFATTLESACFGGNPLPVSRFHDYFSSCLPQPQKGPAVDLPLYQDNIPVFTGDVRFIPPSNVPLHFNSVGFQELKGALGVMETDQDEYKLVGLSGTSSVSTMDNSGFAPNNLYADVSNVAVATISQLRQAFQLQRLFEKDARGGTRYREILKSHFGVDVPDARVQVPEYLGGKRIPINIDQVLQTSSTDGTSPQGNTAAYSMTSDTDSCFTKSFTEHGYILGFCCVRTDHTYQQGVERMWSRKGRFDYYWPTLAHLSEQPVLVKEIYATGSDSDDDAFGYQEAWAEYRYKPNRVSGAFRSNLVGSLDSWHYADYYTGGNENFVLSSTWLSESPVNIDRTLAVQSVLEDQFIADFYFKLRCVRPMPLYSVPGLIDHF